MPPPPSAPPQSPAGNPWSLPALPAQTTDLPYGSGARSTTRSGSQIPGGPTYGPMGLTPNTSPRGSPSPRRPTRDERRESRERDRREEELFDDPRTRDWLVRLNAVERGKREVAQGFARIEQDVHTTMATVAGYDTTLTNMQKVIDENHDR